MKNKHVKRINLLLSILLGAGVFIFFGVYYSYHLHYQEQFQMFLFTSDYFVEQVSHPGGMADYLGGFLTQFYYYSWAGAAILTGAIGGIHRLMVWIAKPLDHRNIGTGYSIRLRFRLVPTNGSRRRCVR